MAVAKRLSKTNRIIPKLVLNHANGRAASDRSGTCFAA